MEQLAGRLMLNDVLTAAARLTHDGRRARIAQCVAATGRHQPDALPLCEDPATQQLVRYCDRCWSVVDPHGRTWNWPPRSAMRRSPVICGLVICAALAACQSGPTAPALGRTDPGSTNQTSILSAGLYVLSVGNSWLIAEPDPSACIGSTDAWAPFGPHIAAYMVVSPQGDGWIGRMELPADGTAELQVRRSGTGVHPTLTGTLRGTMTDLFDRFLTNARRGVSFGKDASASVLIDGTLLPADAFIGNASGDITFTPTSGGGLLSCSKAAVILSRAQ